MVPKFVCLKLVICTDPAVDLQSGGRRARRENVCHCTLKKRVQERSQVQLYCILKEYSSNLVLHFHKVGGLTRVQLKAEKKIKEAEAEMSCKSLMW